MTKAVLSFLMLMAGCSHESFDKHVAKVERDRFMGSWYVQAGRFTPFEKDPYNAVEKYTWDDEKKRIDVDFSYNEGSLNGPVKKIPQIAFIEDHPSNARWQVRPFWPLLFDYRVIALDADYQWTAIGVPNEKYLWIMSRDPKLSREKVNDIIAHLKTIGYRTDKLEFVKHNP